MPTPRVLAGISLLTLVVASVCHAAWPIDRFLERATVIATVRVLAGRVIDGAPEPCQHAYQVEVRAAYRGQMPETGIVTGAAMSVGADYLIVAATTTKWDMRQRSARPVGSDSVEYPAECRTLTGKSLAIAPAEVFEVTNSVGFDTRWIKVPPSFFLLPTGITCIRESERIEIVRFGANEPLLALNDYCLLEDIIGVISDRPPG